MLIQELTCGKIFPKMPVYENNDKIWENFPKKGLFLIKFSHFSKKKGGFKNPPTLNLFTHL